MAISSSATGLRPGVCTSTTRPTAPYTGQIIFQTDTGTMHNWDGTTWQFLAPTQQRNLLYNGAMQVAQRGTSVAGANGTTYYTVDRWQQGTSTAGSWTQTQESDGPTSAGFTKSLKMLCTTAQSSLSAGSILYIQQPLEGQDCQSIGKGTASAQSLTLSFWVKSNVTGTYVASIIDDDNTRDCNKTYTINNSGVWEYKTITYPPDTTGTFANDNGRSLMAFFWLAAGSNYTSGTLNTSWASITTANRAVGQVNLASAVNNYWQITGVQLNVGSYASPFEFKSYAREFSECQRYYYKYANASGNGGGLGYITGFSATRGFGYIHIPTEMRGTITITPTSCQFDSLSLSNVGNITALTTYPTVANAANTTTLMVDCTLNAGGVAGTLYHFRVASGGSIQFSAEL